jgi:hypothetical protein
MIMNKWSKKYLAWPMCLLFIVGLAVGSNGSILCIGDNGHTNIESICQPCCGEAEDSCDLAESNSNHDHHDECDNCTDRPLFQDPLLSRSISRLDIDGKISLGHLIYQAFNLNSQTLSSSILIPKTDSDISFEKAGQSTTVLRC